jgi:hypothetical protein
LSPRTVRRFGGKKNAPWTSHGAIRPKCKLN